MNTTGRKKLISNTFAKLHEQLSSLRSHVEALEDPDALAGLESVEFGLLGPMRRLRLYLEIPYDWHDESVTEKKAARS
jgi:hypothetical protein